MKGYVTLVTCSFLVYLWILIPSVASIGERFVTQLCPGSVGPSHGEVIRFDPSSEQGSWVVPTSDLDCYVTIRGMSEVAGTPEKFVTLSWRDNDFSFRGRDYSSSGGSCNSAFIEIYEANDSGMFTSPPLVGPTCGVVPPAEVTTSAQVLVVRFYVEAGNVSSTGGGPNSSLPSNFDGPYINFTADFTSYFVGNCSADGTLNDDNQLYCDTGRCLDDSLRCDIYFSDNCGDLGDVRASPPGNCIFVTDEDDDDDDDDADLLPLWIILGLLAALAMLYWCCWRPGWCPWRCARLRNVACCKGCAQRCSCCRPTGCCKCCSCCRSTGSGYPSRTPGSDPPPGHTPPGGTSCFPCCRRGPRGDSSVPYKAGLGTPGWLEFISDDGCHVREMR